VSAISDRERAERFMLQTDVPSGHAWADRTKPDWNYIPVPVALAALLGEVREEERERAAGVAEDDCNYEKPCVGRKCLVCEVAAAIRALSSKASS